MDQIQHYFQLLLSSEQIIRVGGVALVTLIVFCETGLFFCFWLPGDYLLFSAGLLCAGGVLKVPIGVLFICIFTAAVLGNLAGYLFGRFLGYKFDTMRESIFFKRKYIENTRKTFERYGGRALVVGRFLPIIRTFAPILAGMSKLYWPSFLVYNVLGGLAWVGALVVGGYYLGLRFPEIIHYLEYIILGFIAFTSIVLVRSLAQMRKGQPTNEHTSA